MCGTEEDLLAALFVLLRMLLLCEMWRCSILGWKIVLLSSDALCHCGFLAHPLNITQ